MSYDWSADYIKASSKDCTLEDFLELKNKTHSDLSVLLAIIQNSKCPEYILYSLLDYNDSWIQEKVLDKKNHVLLFSQKALKSKFSKIRKIALQNPDLESKDVMLCAEDEDFFTQFRAMMHRNLPIEGFWIGLNSDEHEIRNIVLMNYSCPLRILEHGFLHEDWSTRMQAVYHRNVSLEMLEKGLKDKDRQVRETAKMQLEIRNKTDSSLIYNSIYARPQL